MTEVAVALVLLATFITPGALLAGALRPGAQAYPALGYPALAATGFVNSLAVFGMLAWPFLWLGANAGAFWAALGLTWALYTAGAAWAWVRSRSNSRHMVTSVEGDEPATPAPDGARPDRWVAVGLCVYVAWSGYAASNVMAILMPGRPASRDDCIILGLCLATGLSVAACLPRDFRPAPRSHEATPWSWAAAAVLALAALAVGVTLNARPDWDDAETLATVARQAEGGPLNRESASLPGEGLPVAPHMRLLAWELFGATLCRFSGLPPLVTHHTLLPPVLFVMVVAAQWQLLGERLLPWRLVPLALLGLAAYWAFGNSAYDNAGNYLLTRTWQGKTVLWQLGLPVYLLALWRFLDGPSLASWVAATLAATGSLAMSTSAVYLLPALAMVLCLTTAIYGRRAKPIGIYAATGCTLGAVVAYGLVLRWAVASFPSISVRPLGASWQQSLYQSGTQYGVSEFVWALTLPLLAALAPSRSSRAYLVGLPLVLLFTIANPFCYEWVALHLSSYWTYFRLFWLLPVGLGLGCVAALVGDAVARAWAFSPGARQAVALAVVLGLALALVWLPDRYVWDPNNRGPYPGLEPTWGTNSMKVPGDLVPILRRLAEGPRRPQGRVLFSEALSPYFAPYNRGVPVVSSRPSYTVEAFRAVGRPEEGVERSSLAVSFLDFEGTAGGVLPPGWVRPVMKDGLAGELMSKYRVGAVVIERGDDGVGARLARLGLYLEMTSGRYQLWTRPVLGQATDNETAQGRVGPIRLNRRGQERSAEDPQPPS